MRKMMPIGPLMIEHRLIERMIHVINEEVKKIDRESSVKSGFIETVVDFIRTYADRCHHGKEEDILFRDLKKKNISSEHLKIMEELIEEHLWGRKTSTALVSAHDRYRGGDETRLGEIKTLLRNLADFYPRHIEKEDKHFFLPVMEYFSQEERDRMLQEGFEFDQKLIHEKYRSIVETAENIAAT
jgi:hemerythrin-like domain-containing protein